MKIVNHIYMPQGSEVSGIANLGLVQGVDGSGIELFNSAYQEVFGEDVRMGAGQDGVAWL